MAENNTNRQTLGLNMPSVTGVRRSNLRLAFPNQTRSPNDHPQNNLDFPASGYPASHMDNQKPATSVFPRFMEPKVERSGGGASSTGNTTAHQFGDGAATVATSSLTSSMQRPGCLHISNQHNGPQMSSPPREQKKKQLVLHLPPPHSNLQSSSSNSNHNHQNSSHQNHQNHNHHHHQQQNNQQHNRNLFHPESLRDRSQKSAKNATSNGSPPSVKNATPNGSPSSVKNATLNGSPSSVKNATPNGSPSRERVSRGMYQNMQSSGKLQITPELQVEFTADDLTDLGEIGRGGFGTVNKMVHRKSNTIMAVKRIRSTVDEKEQKQLLMDLEVVMRSNDCPCIVQFYGAIFKEGDCWICMELMDTSLDKFYKFIYERLSERLPENILGKITVATLTALNYLKEKLKIIHRDVKPSNILLDKRGNIKLCDFGISGQLVDSIAKTRDAGCRPYMAPERIDPARARGYDVRSDVWSLGITLMELATGSFPYPKWNSVFEQLTQVVQGEPPRLSNNENGNSFSEEFVSFVNTCLIKEESCRPKYRMLLEHEFVTRSKADPVDVADFVSNIMDKMANNGRNIYTYDSYNY